MNRNWRVVIGLAAMVYELLYHTPQNMVSVCVRGKRIYDKAKSARVNDLFSWPFIIPLVLVGYEIIIVSCTHVLTDVDSFLNIFRHSDNLFNNKMNIIT